MKKLLSYLSISLVALVYGVSVIGVGVYDCHCSHSQQLVWLANDDCTCKHEHQHGHDSGGHCCDVTYKVLQLDQDVNSDQLFVVNHSTVLDFMFIPVEVITLPAPAIAEWYDHDPPPLLSPPTPDIYCLSQLRL